LDRDTEGLLFLTNDGEFCLRLTHPRYGVRKKYLATVEGRIEPPVLARLRAGVLHGGERLRAERTRLISANASTSLVELELTEGKHHEVRRLFESQGFPVLALQRTQIGPIRLGELPVGKYRVLTPSEVRTLNALTAAPPQPTPAGKPAPRPSAAARRPDVSKAPEARSESGKPRPRLPAEGGGR
jgi:pseudouridine synthase